jgi:putative phage-type endonuclease
MNHLINRHLGIGGSDCASALNLSRYKTQYELWEEKTNPELKKQNNSVAMELGNELENFILRKYSEKTGFKVEKPSITYVSKKYPWMYANLDGVILDQPALFEAKTTGFFNKEDWGNEGDQLPDEYILQCAHYCIVMSEYKDVEYVDIEALGMANRQFRSFKYERNQKLEERIIEEEHKFWNLYIKGNTPPPLTKNDDLNKIFALAKEKSTIVADNDVSNLFYNLHDLKKQIKISENRIEEIETKIKTYMNEHENLIDINGNELITWRNSIRQAFDSNSFKKQNAELYKKFIKETNVRTFRIKNNDNS